jgi:hypothetical protein
MGKDLERRLSAEAGSLFYFDISVWLLRTGLYSTVMATRYLLQSKQGLYINLTDGVLRLSAKGK